MEDEYYPTFHLDMLTFIGQPLKPLTRQSEQFFDNITVTFRNWSAPYSSKHTHGISFELDYRTFRIATAASREAWYIVMHPIAAPVRDLPTSWREHRLQSERSSQQSAMRSHHAGRLADYVRRTFSRGQLLGEGIEPSWTLGGTQSQRIAFNKWTLFQEAFVSGWPAFADENSGDEFWTVNRPAFHAYDHGANIEIEVNDYLETLPREARMRPEDEDEEDGGDSDDEAVRTGTRPSAGEPRRDAPAPTAVDAIDYERLYEGRLQRLRDELEGKYVLENIGTVCYALAANINCLDGRAVDGEKPACCLLANRNVVNRQYARQHDYTFYPLGFHPGFGNFTSRKPPEFLQDRLLVMQENMSYQNDGTDPLTFGYFQAYSNIKRTIRHDPAALLATKGTTTAALTLPASEAALSSRTRTKRGQLLAAIQGQRTPDNHEASKPFARESRQIQAAIDAEEYAVRLEQVLSMDVERLADRRRTFTTVLNPIFELIRFFLKEPARYSRLFYAFKPTVFPGVLCTLTRMFSLAMDEMLARLKARGFEDIGVALAEGVAAVDRIGNYCLTGSSMALMGSVLGPLGTIDGIHFGAWPYINPKLLSLHRAAEGVDLSGWPRGKDGRPLLMHSASLRFHYGPEVAARRTSSVWFREFGGQAVSGPHSATTFLNDLFQELWVPEMTTFVCYQANRAIRSKTTDPAELKELIEIVQRWSQAEHPFQWRWVARSL